MKLRLLKIVWKAIKNNAVSFLLLFTVLMGFSYDYIDWPMERVSWHEHPASYSWFAYFVMHYIIGLIFIVCIALPKSEIDKYVLYSYMVFDAYGFYSYVRYGWPEPKNDIIVGFCLVVLFLVGRLLWKNSIYTFK